MSAEHIDAAVEAMEAGHWTSAVALLIGLLSRAEADPGCVATLRLLLAQALHESGEPHRAILQARQALKSAEQTDDRGLIWKCMALIASINIIDHGRL